MLGDTRPVSEPLDLECTMLERKKLIVRLACGESLAYEIVILFHGHRLVDLSLSLLLEIHIIACRRSSKSRYLGSSTP